MTFDDLRLANVERCTTAFFPLEYWNAAEWGCAAAGEMGEACNKIKKANRHDGDPTPEEARGIAEELADAVIYADLLCARMGVSLGDAVLQKFNEVSRRKNSPILLTPTVGMGYNIADGT